MFTSLISGLSRLLDRPATRSAGTPASAAPAPAAPRPARPVMPPTDGRTPAAAAGTARATTPGTPPGTPLRTAPDGGPDGARGTAIPASPAAPAAGTPRGAASPAGPGSAAAATPLGLGARRPLVATDGQLAGFEFHVGTALRGGARDDTLARVRTTNLLGAMRLCVAQQREALAELPAGWIAACCSEGQVVPGMSLVLAPDPQFNDPDDLVALTQHLRHCGARVGWRDTGPGGAPMPPGTPDLMPLAAPSPQATAAAAAAPLATAPAATASPAATAPQPPGSPDAAAPSPAVLAWRARIAQAAEAWPGVPLVLLDLPDIDTLEAVLSTPVALAACTLATPQARAGAEPRAQALPPQATRVLRLLNRLVRDDDTALLVAEIKSDTALSLRLLQYLNSAGAGIGRPLESIDQAVMLLGRDALYRWVAQMLVRMAPPRPASQALQDTALARARLLELLGRAAGEPNPGTLYLMGLASMLPTLMNCSLDEALQSMQLPPAAQSALRGEPGPWQPHLALMLALERHDMASAERLAPAFGGLDAVLARAAQAWLRT